MKVPVFDLEGRVASKVELPPVFKTPFRQDLIKRVFVAQMTHRLQPQGRDPLAGKRTSAESWGVGRGMARLARVKGERHPSAGQAAGVASVVKGRQAHPPRAEKAFWKRVNKKERRLAIASAIAATAERELVSLRGHKVASIRSLPIVVLDEVQGLKRTKDLRSLLEKLGLKEELLRASRGRKVRSGKPKWRGRTTKSPRGPIIVLSEDLGVGKAVRNLPGVDCALAKDLTLLQLAPGSHSGRLAIWSRSALKVLPKALLEIGSQIVG